MSLIEAILCFAVGIPLGLFFVGLAMFLDWALRKIEKWIRKRRKKNDKRRSLR